MPQTDVLPVDPNVSVPEVVRRAAAAADAAHQAAYATESPAAPAAPTDPSVTGPVTDVQPAPTLPVEPAAPAAPSAPPDQVNWEHRYHSMEGRFRQANVTIGSMQQQMQEMGDELQRMHALLNASRAQSVQDPVQVTDKDREQYGTDLLDTMARTARAAVAPELNSLRTENDQLKRQVTQDRRAGVWAQLDGALPDWRNINESDRFKAWLRLPDLYSGVPRLRLINAAFQAADAPRVLAFFRGFLNEAVVTGQQSVPSPLSGQPTPAPAPQPAAVPLDSLAAPGRAKPAPGNQPGAADKPVFTRAQIADFYANVRRGAYAGRQEEKDRLEAAIFAAQNEGRVR